MTFIVSSFSRLDEVAVKQLTAVDFSPSIQMLEVNDRKKVKR